MRHQTGEPIEVAPFDGAPAQFLLRGRLHVVRSVLASWTEPGGWRWSGPGRVVAIPVGAGVGGSPPAEPGIPSVPFRPSVRIDGDEWGREAQLPFRPSAPIDRDEWGREAQLPYRSSVPVDRDERGREAQLPFIPSVPIDLGDRDVWRVEAAAGMGDRLRVFDLCREPDPDLPRWTATLVEE